MRRTYKSKKDTAGGLDHRDAFLTMDEKSSAFDAFYIQNIKQTKREMSCMGSSNNHGVASSKVRKRKYVKRIVKDVEPILQASMSASAYLTPDKSLHVNKAPDLFDQLFNSSSRVNEPERDKKEDLFENILPRKETKTYNRKKPLKKRFNYTSSDSTESDKENTKDATTNASDIKAYELLIEKEAKLSPKLDESINKIVKNLSLLNNLNKRSHNRSIVKTLGNNKNRLTKNFDLLRHENSPLSSTPFTEKQRSKSIYKFSPIPMGDLGDSPNYVTIAEENNEVNDSIVFVPKNSSKQPITPPDDIQTSPITHITNKNSTNFNSNSKSLFSSQDSAQQCSIDYGEIQENSQRKNRTNEEEMVEKISKTQSSLQISEVEPFFGFSENSIKITKINKLLIEEEKDNSIILPVSTTTKHSKSSEHSKIENEINSSYNNQNSAVTTTTEYTIPSEPFLGFTNIETENLCSESEQDSPGTNSDANESVSSNSQEERQSLYDTCDSNNSFDEEKAAKPLVLIERMDTPIFQKYYKGMANYNSQDDNDEEKAAKPLVVIERMDTSLFQKYYEEMANHNSQDDIDNSADTSAEYATFESDESIINDELNTSSYNAIEEMPTEKSNIKSNDGESESSNISGDSNEETYVHDDPKVNEDTNNEIFDSFEIDSAEERCISFVTTRRRKEITNNVSILVLDDSQSSSSSSNCDKTVLSNKIKNQNDVSLIKTEEIDKNVILIDETRDNSDTTNTSKRASIPDTSASSITRKSSDIRDSFKYKSPEHSIAELTDARPPIVLQPGKKWERSLSIYRRMTTINDHFDHSILEDEDLHLKGRNYRQSVISTMKMQESQGLLHNESINSRRSTFVSKPSRSTIRIVKETNSSRVSLSNTTIFDDLKGFLEDCDDTIVELSKLSIAEEHEVTVLDKFHDSSRVTTARDFVLRRCNQTDTILFDECYPDTTLKNCRKIGEGVYGEVFLWRATDGRARVMKIVPIAGSIKVNGEHQKDFHEIISEIVIAMELSALRTPIAEIERHFDEGKDIETLDLHSVENATDVFNEVKAVRCVYGSYPSRLLDLWELYDECKGSENDNPAILPVDQQYIVLELANAGQDLESYQFNSAEQAHALFLQVAFGLAVGEEAFQFEHRDLHWGNVLIAPTEQKYATFVLRGRAHRVPRRGVAATIIDYSLSRLSLPLAGYESAAALYNDLSTDEGLFGAVGDYQFEVYRLMREKLGNEWKNFEPYTNILWLHYTVDKMITALRYKRTNTKTHKQYIAKLKGIKDRILHYGGATQFVLTDNEF